MKTLLAHSVALVATVALGASAVAQPAQPAPSATQPFGCRTKRTVTHPLKAENELKDLIVWAMGFSCKNFTFDPRIVSTGAKFTIIAPETMEPDDAYQLFLHAITAVDLTVVPKGNMLRIVQSATAVLRTGVAVPAVYYRPTKPAHIVLTATKPSPTEPMTFELSVKR